MKCEVEILPPLSDLSDNVRRVKINGVEVPVSEVFVHAGVGCTTDITLTLTGVALKADLPQSFP